MSDSAHPAFDKACQYLHVKLVRIPVGKDLRADVSAMERAITSNTIMIVGSCPAFPHGVLDPIEELAKVALKRDVGLHVDACFGGFLMPWLKR